MSTDHPNEPRPDSAARPDPVEPTEPPAPAPPAVPESVEAADIDRDRAIVEPDPERPARGVDWVRPSDLISRAGGALSRKGIDFQAELFQRARTGIGAGTKRTAAYARRLPGLSWFGHEEPAPEARGLGRE